VELIQLVKNFADKSITVQWVLLVIWHSG